MQGKYINIYKSARLTAGLSQERAAEGLHLSVESLKGYETGLRVPCNAVVVQMVTLYDRDCLALMHLMQTASPLGVLPRDLEMQSLPAAVLQLVNRIFDFSEKHRDTQLMHIAEDSIIDAEERPHFDEIVAELQGIIGAAFVVRYADGIGARP
ncbi:MAG: helix-turn-helix transcriptional regulator [Oscillospiraceae bacterium]